MTKAVLYVAKLSTEREIKELAIVRSNTDSTLQKKMPVHVELTKLSTYYIAEKKFQSKNPIIANNCILALLNGM